MSLRIVPTLSAIALAALATLAACGAQRDRAEGEGASAVDEQGLIRCGANEVRECTNEGPGGTKVCSCVPKLICYSPTEQYCDASGACACVRHCEVYETRVCPGGPSTCICQRTAECVADPAPNPPELARCQRGVYIPNADTEVWMCPVGTPVPPLGVAPTGTFSGKMVAGYQPGPSFTFDYVTNMGTYIARSPSCLPVPNSDWFYFTVWTAPELWDGGGTGCRGGCIFNGP